MITTTRPATILLMFAQLMEKYRKKYLYISQEKMLLLLEAYHDYRIKRRMLNYRLAELEAAGLIRRVQRNKKCFGGRIEPMTSLIFLTSRAHKLIARQFKAILRAINRKVRKPFNLDVQYPEVPREQELSRQECKEKARALSKALA